MERSLPPQCEPCPVANFILDKFNEAADQESVAIRVEAEARLLGEEELATIASSALAKVALQRQIAEGGLYGLRDCPGYTNKCGKGLEL